MLVHRVNWLRARARLTRWQEEVVLIKTEMDSTIRFFTVQAEKWTARVISKSSVTPGHVCYAKKQESMWTNLADQAYKAFINLGVVVEL